MDSMTNSERVLHGSLYCLTFITGLVDAGSYVAMGHVFTANMTGDGYLLGSGLYNILWFQKGCLGEDLIKDL